MPDGSSNAIPISVRLPADIVEKLDKVAAIMERPRSWVILDAVREYLADEGQEMLDIQAGIEEADRGETVPFEDVLAEMAEKIRHAQAKRRRRAARRFTLEELFAGKSPQEWREDYAGAYDWGPDLGREIVEE